jgi:hypothetical protein
MKSPFVLAIERNLAGIESVNPGACPGCSECGLAPRHCRLCWGLGYLEPSDDGYSESLPPMPDSSPEVRQCPDCSGEGTIPINPDSIAGQHEIECAEAGGFSWHACDCCGSRLGGNRSPAHGFLSQKLAGALAKIPPGSPDGQALRHEAFEQARIHLDICQDCLLFLANGDEPETWE